jgi:hypothetical protein
VSFRLKRRYRLLLSFYPDAYRDTHEEELLTTLLDAAAPGQDYPSARETVGLIVGGMRTRSRLAMTEGWLAVWTEGLRLAALLLLVLLFSDSLRQR